MYQMIKLDFIGISAVLLKDPNVELQSSEIQFKNDLAGGFFFEN